MKKLKLFLGLVLVAFLCPPIVSAHASVIALSNVNLLKVGCYVFTDRLEYERPDEVLFGSPLQDAFLGKSVQRVNCSQAHHLEISSLKSSRSSNSLRLDSIPLKTGCINASDKNRADVSVQEKTQLYFKVYRQGKLNRSVCGMSAPSFAHPRNPSYRIYEAFTSPHFRNLGQS